VRRRHQIAPSPLHVVAPANALAIDELRAATATLDRSRPLLVLCEGLIGYLTREETARIAANVRTLIGEHAGGRWIVPDFAFKTEISNLPAERIRLREAITGVTQRQLDASAFNDAEDLAAFLGRIGFEVEVRSQIDETPSFSTIEALGLAPAVLDRLRPALRVWLMKPVSAH
jgi:O-methyltransferase involved in polyketide biosynthesis